MKIKALNNIQMCKAIISTIIIVSTLICTFSISANAAFVYTGVDVESPEGGFLGIGRTTYTYKIFKDTRDWFVIFSNKNLCDPQYHLINNGLVYLIQDRDVEYTSESAYQFATRWECNTSRDVINKTTEAGFGLMQTVGKVFASGGTYNFTLSATAPTGYYRTNVCHPYELYMYEKYDPDGNRVEGDYEAIIPIDLPVVKVIYSNNSGTGGSIYN